ncbi:MAG TPA: hypothetical protein VFS00_19825, partial [Polyangiaceae bacterium]|nr:hypothetical protein [Polyangiaceae bacterium]
NGRLDEARKLLLGQSRRLQAEKARAAALPAKTPAEASAVARVNDDYARQARALDDTQRDFERAAPATTSPPRPAALGGGGFFGGRVAGAAPAAAPPPSPEATHASKAAAKRAIDAANPFSR